MKVMVLDLWLPVLAQGCMGASPTNQAIRVQGSPEQPPKLKGKHATNKWDSQLVKLTPSLARYLRSRGMCQSPACAMGEG